MFYSYESHFCGAWCYHQGNEQIDLKNALGVASSLQKPLKFFWNHVLKMELKTQSGSPFYIEQDVLH